MKYNLNSNNYYEILGVPKDSDSKTIKKAYHKLAIKYHPDKNDSDKKEEYEKLFQKIHEAYSKLSDQNERSNYDSFTNTQNNNFFNFNVNNSNNNSDMFNSFFGNNNTTNTFETNTFSYSFTNLNGNIDVNYNYSTYTNFGEEYNKMNHDLNKFKSQQQEASLFDDKKSEIRIQNSTKVTVKHNDKILNGYIKDYKNNFYTISTDNGDIEEVFSNIQQVLKGKLVGLKGDYSHINDDYSDILSYNYEHNKYLIKIYGCELVINPENVILNNKSYVKIFNLKNKKDLNDKWGLVLAYDFNEKKYLIKLESNKIVKVSFNNIAF